MCLKKIDKKTKHIKYGWKLVNYGSGILTNEFGHYDGRRTILTTFHKVKWNTDSRKKDITIYSPSTTGAKHYPCGFHIFIKKADAIKYRSEKSGLMLMKVEVKDIVCSGLQRISGAETWNTRNSLDILGSCFGQVIICKKFRFV